MKVRPGQIYQGRGDNFTVTVIRRESAIPEYWRCTASDGRRLGIADEALRDPTLYTKRH
jgi:hypothetical protein